MKKDLKGEKFRNKALQQITNLNQLILDQFQKIQVDSDIESEDIQLLDDFEKMGHQEPNEEGTGRISVKKNFNTIGIINLSLEKSLNINDTLMLKIWLQILQQIFLALQQIFKKSRKKKDCQQDCIKEWINKYLGLRTTTINLNLALYYEKKQFYIEEMYSAFSMYYRFCTQYFHQKYLETIYDEDIIFIQLHKYQLINLKYQFQRKNEGIMNDKKILCARAIIKLKPKHICSLIAIIDQDIFDPLQPDSNIVGRACGDGVCVVQFQENLKVFYGTIVHELMHTLGFDHCYLWNCLMNEDVDQSSLHLCVNDLEKLSMIKQYDKVKRYQSLLSFYKKVGFQEECKWIEKMIEIFEQ